MKYDHKQNIYLLSVKEISKLEKELRAADRLKEMIEDAFDEIRNLRKSVKQLDNDLKTEQSKHLKTKYYTKALLDRLESKEMEIIKLSAINTQRNFSKGSHNDKQSRKKKRRKPFIFRPFYV